MKSDAEFVCDEQSPAIEYILALLSLPSSVRADVTWNIATSPTPDVICHTPRLFISSGATSFLLSIDLTDSSHRLAIIFQLLYLFCLLVFNSAFVLLAYG